MPQWLNIEKIENVMERTYQQGDKKCTTSSTQLKKINSTDKRSYKIHQQIMKVWKTGRYQ